MCICVNMQLTLHVFLTQRSYDRLLKFQSWIISYATLQYHHIRKHIQDQISRYKFCQDKSKATLRTVLDSKECLDLLSNYRVRKSKRVCFQTIRKVSIISDDINFIIIIEHPFLRKFCCKSIMAKRQVATPKYDSFDGIQKFLNLNLDTLETNVGVYFKL